jgi:hypothetical protein
VHDGGRCSSVLAWRSEQDIETSEERPRVVQTPSLNSIRLEPNGLTAARFTEREQPRRDGESAVYKRLNSFWISSNARRASMARSSSAVESWKIASCCGP